MTPKEEHERRHPSQEVTWTRHLIVEDEGVHPTYWEVSICDLCGKEFNVLRLGAPPEDDHKGD